MLQLIVAALLILAAVVLFTKYRYSYWKRHGILQIPPTFPFGNTRSFILRKEPFGHNFKLIYDYVRSRKQVVGGYYMALSPGLLIVDPELLKCVLVKDFAHFMDRGVHFDEENDPLSANIFNLTGNRWKNLRAKLTPTFTSGKLKMMFTTIFACSNELREVFNELIKTSEPIDIRNILSRYTMDVIGSCAFGIDCNSMKNPDDEFRKHGLAIFEVKGVDFLRQVAALVYPGILKLLRIPQMNPESAAFYMRVVKDTVEYREKNNVLRNDFMQLLLKLKNESDAGESGLSMEQIAAQCFVFFLAGFETSSATITFCLFELASNEEIQEKLRQEIRTVLKKHNGQISYDAIMEMTYLDKVISETLRKYPPLPFLNREVTLDYKIPGTNYVAKKGTTILISVEGIHWDEEYYPEPQKFDPERFCEDEKQKRPNYTYLPFGEGPRICIGLRFGLMQTKAGVVQIINNFKCTVNRKTKVPLVMSPKSFMMTAEGNVWLDFEKV